SGIWHGAGWLFIIWGLLHGISILIHRIWKEKGYSIPDILGQALTLFFVNIFWVFFRANSLLDVKKVLLSMIDYRSLDKFITIHYRDLSSEYFRNLVNLSILLVAITIISLLPSYRRVDKVGKKWKIKLEIVVYITSSLLLIQRATTFLYFNF
ncbi:MAG: MBOAT family protein, partial [Cetobacterium sp.]